MQFIYAAVIFASVTAAAMIVLLPFAPGRAKQRLDAVAGDPELGGAAGQVQWSQTVVNVAGKFAKLSLPSEGWEDSPLRRRFLHAGFRGDAPVMLYFGAKTLLAVLLPVIAYFYIMLGGTKFGTNAILFMLLSAGAIGYYLPNVVLSRLVFIRQREIFETFPDAADLLLVCVEAGLGLDAALVKVAEEMRLNSQALAEELHLVNLELRAGSSREKALRNLALRTGVEEVNTFATMLIQADRFGTSIGESLRVFSDELRTKRQMRAEEIAAKIPLKLLFPMVFCIFPALLLVLLGPAFIQVYRILLPTMAGQ
ncbi:MAG TPA: type II secretion system F family protein [Burkholderiales bacterium]|nr:type II secretion system F family protein [Burkholderiales bacterium]